MRQKKVSSDFKVPKHIPAKQLSTLLKVSSVLAASLDLSIVLQIAIESAAEVMNLETGAIYSLEGDCLLLEATTPPLDPLLWPILRKPEPICNHPHIAEALLSGQPVYLNDSRTADLSPAEKSISEIRNLISTLYIPLLLKGNPIGVMIVSSTSQVHEFTEEEIDLCRTFSYQVALAVTNARLFNSVQQTNVELVQAYDATLQGWSLALEMRDEVTQGHTQRVTEMTVELARKSGVPEENLVHIRRGALLHDIGKMGIPDMILKKANPLSEEDWRVMRKHPEYAYQFLKQIDYLAPALDIPYCHHEKWDGSGYPRELKGEEIPLAARIFAIVDVYDALISNRTYRKAWQKESVTAYMREQSGKHFDPRIVNIFLNEVVGA